MRKSTSTSTNPKLVNLAAENGPELKVSQHESVSDPCKVVESKASENMDVDDKSKCTKCEFKFKDPYTLKCHMRDEYREISASVTPPPKKRMEQENDIEKEVEIIVNKIQDMGVKEHDSNSKTIEDIEVPKRLTNMFRLKESNIDQLKVVRVG